MYLGPWLVTRGVFIGIIILIVFSSIVTTGLTTPTTSLASGEVDENQSISVLELNSKLPGDSIPDLGNCEVSNNYPESVLQWCDLITIYAEKFELSPDLIAAMIWQESGGKPRAY